VEENLPARCLHVIFRAVPPSITFNPISTKHVLVSPSPNKASAASPPAERGSLTAAAFAFFGILVNQLTLHPAVAANPLYSRRFESPAHTHNRFNIPREIDGQHPGTVSGGVRTLGTAGGTKDAAITTQQQPWSELVANIRETEESSSGTSTVFAVVPSGRRGKHGCFALGTLEAARGIESRSRVYRACLSDIRSATLTDYDVEDNCEQLMTTSPGVFAEKSPDPCSPRQQYRTNTTTSERMLLSVLRQWFRSPLIQERFTTYACAVGNY